jgi:hypothetical protein
MTERVVFFVQETEAMKARVEFCDEASTTDAQEFLYWRRVFLQKEANAMTEGATFFQREADALKELEKAAVREEKDALEDRADFFAAEEAKYAKGKEEKKQKRGPFGFLRRKNGKGVAEKAAAVSAPIVEDMEKAAAKVKTTEDEGREMALETNKALRKRLREEKEKEKEVARELREKMERELRVTPGRDRPQTKESAGHEASKTESERFPWDQWREYVREEESTVAKAASNALSSANDELSKVGLGAVAEVTQAEKAIKKKGGLFGFLRRKKGKDAKTNPRKPKKGRVHAKASKKGLFGFLRRKKAADADGNDTA